MTYKGCEIIRTESYYALTGHPLYRIDGKFTKRADQRPWLATTKDAKEWINDQIIFLEFSLSDDYHECVDAALGSHNR